jgi:hypothetical protein
MRRNITVQRVEGGFAVITTGVLGTTEFNLIKNEAELSKWISKMRAQLRAQGDELEVTPVAEVDRAMQDAIDKAVPPTS